MPRSYRWLTAIVCILLVAALTAGLIVFWLRLPPAREILTADTTWSAATEPRVVEHRVVVPSGVTLTIEPGTTILFKPRTGLWIAGRLVAEGTAGQRIRLARPRLPFKLWAGITFENSQQDNRLRYIDIESAGSEGQSLHLKNSRATVEHARFFGAQRKVIESADSSLVLRHSVFDPIGENEVLHVRRTPVGGEFVVEGNIFYPNFGYNDLVDAADCKAPGAIPRFINNIFLGGGDDGLDIDRSEAYIEGNVFMNFYLKGHKKYADAISVGNNSKIIATNNLFIYNDQAIAVMENAHITLLNNTFYRNRQVVIGLDERGHGPGGAIIRDCIFSENPTIFEYADQATELVIERTVIPNASRWPGHDNLDADPQFGDPANGDFIPKHGSPAAGRGAAIPATRMAGFNGVR